MQNTFITGLFTQIQVKYGQSKTKEQKYPIIHNILQQ